MRKRIPIKPRKSHKKTLAVILLAVFLTILVLTGLGILTRIFWKDIVNFLGTSGTLIILCMIVVIITVSSSLITNYILSHKGDEL